MKNALIAAAVCVACAATASATSPSEGNMAGKINTKQARTVSEVVDAACDRGETVVKTDYRTVPRFFAGRMVPARVEFEKTVCN